MAIDKSHPMTPPHSNHHPVSSEYARLAARYDRRWARYVEKTHRETLRCLESLLSPRARLLDLGCGTGALLARLVDAQTGSLDLVGLDLSPEMLAIARARLPYRVKLLEGNA